MKSLVTTKGQVTIPKALRDHFGIRPGTKVAFTATEDGLRLRKVVDREKRSRALGCLKLELADRSVPQLLEELRGLVELPPINRKGVADDHRCRRYLGLAVDLQG